MWEETLGFFVLLVPLTLALGYDRMVAASIIFLGAGTGVLALDREPVRHRRRLRRRGHQHRRRASACGSLMWVVLVALAIGYVLRYARRVAQRPAPLGRRHLADRRARTRSGLIEDVPALTGRQKLVLGPVRRRVPGDDLRLHPLERPLAGRSSAPTSRCRRSRPSTSPRRRCCSSSLAVVIGLIAKLGEEGTVNTIIAGAADFLGAALVIVLARGDHRRDEEHLHDRHGPALDGGRGLGHLAGRVRRARAARQHPDRVPRAVVVRARRAGDADPRAAGRLRRRRALGRRDRLPVGVRPREPASPRPRR